MTSANNTLTAVPGLRVGHQTHRAGATGCTVILMPASTVGGVDQRGGAPGTRETDLLHPLNLVHHIHAIVLSGGSAFGLATADGVMRYLEAQGVGYPLPSGVVVPIVPTAILMDLDMGQRGIRPDAAMGYAACEAATDDPVEQGSVGVGTGCRIGTLWGPAHATKGGLGSAAVRFPDGLVVAALCAVNAFGDVLDEQGAILGGLRNRDGRGWANTMVQLGEQGRLSAPSLSQTVIGVVATNAQLSKEAVNKVAQMAHDGLARAVNPAHTMVDGDTLFAAATGAIPADVNLVGAYAAEVTAQAIRNGVRAATSLAGLRAWNES